jgi:ribose 5-phosphate isomerase B
MTKITVALAADHGGFKIKEELKPELEKMGVDCIDLGTDSVDSVDYPDFGRAVADAIADGRAERGVIICGTGIGIAIAANRVGGIRAAVCHDATTARLAREHNDANVLAFGARIIGREVAIDCLRTFLSTPFEGGARHTRRVAKLS